MFVVSMTYYLFVIIAKNVAENTVNASTLKSPLTRLKVESLWLNNWKTGLDTQPFYDKQIRKIRKTFFSNLCQKVEVFMSKWSKMNIKIHATVPAMIA